MVIKKARRAAKHLAIEYRPVEMLVADPNNARKHSKKQIDKLAAGMREFGFTNPILIDKEDQIIAGHGRLLAALQTSMTTVPTVRIAGLSEASRKALAIADNKLGDMSCFDLDLLSAQLAELDGIGFEIGLTGFDTAELDVLIGTTEPAADPADAIPAISEHAIAVTRVGDCWRFENHRIYCGNSLDEESYRIALGGQLADLVFSDPPYNVPIKGHVSGLGKYQHREFAMASGEMSKQAFIEFLSKIFTLAVKFSADGSTHYQCMDFRHMSEMLAAGEVYAELKNVCVWDKGSGGMGSLYRSQHEFVFVWKNGAAPHVNNVQLGRYGRAG